MRRIIAIIYVSLDGVMQAPGGPEEDPGGGFVHGGWAMPRWDEMMNGLLAELLDRPFALLLGRKTYEIFAGYWPHHTDNPIGRKFDAAVKYVMTRRLDRLDWAGSERVDAAGVARLKSGEGPQIHVWGSGNALRALTAAGLVDEYRLWIFPLILGGGKRLFEPGLPATALTLADTKVSTTGVVINTYRPAGPVALPAEGLGKAE
ncbi:dihydrofolate reductase family protein [Paracoccus denitrificans]|jgi:dihydrofolate reductase|uniref:Bifunctional deaminase-reductase domain protein n=1 Tax=Paracoccus denitrificans (strain Pd 1222) TaxID=318586 RepID=A1BA83_PARDP|nr:dihydrofolate reductase family protein [Paracoccus denitrificans]ABL72427.1 bifunctional deaminase-reductase domain protein [Paracoccus denitrificans PD1222]MBB4628558.1 dihydrofolate reductase [Paracoccus denitrificans]MCU7430549.1 dihydrofolate reductase family protein [Paracoccus denitrificans]QAR28981.1 dihydrofolate reductase [Paracoccus denitrificans]UPV97137.1 dihydrofolate reductase family protein [Paracoccus denitrificans]